MRIDSDGRDGANEDLDGAIVANPDQPYIDWIVAALESKRGPDGKRLTRRGLSKVLGVSEPVVTRLLAGDRRLMHYEIPKIAQYLGEPPPQITSGTNSPPATLAPTQFIVKHVPVRGETAGGLWVEYIVGDDTYEHVPVVPTKYADLEQFAYRVRGNSMDKAKILDGDYVVCVPYFMARSQLQDGDIVVVERRRAGLYERTCKCLEVKPNGASALVSRSNDPRHAEPLFTVGDGQADDIEIEIVGLVVGRYSPL